MSWVKNNEWLVAPKDSHIQWQHVRRYLGYYRRFKARLLLAAFLATLGSAVAFLIPWIFTSLQRALSTRNLRLLSLMALLYVSILLFQCLVTYLIGACKVSISTQLNEDLLLQYYRKLLNISVEDFIEFKRRSNLFQRVIDAVAVTAEFTDIVVQGIQAVVVVTMVMFVIARVSLAVAGTALVGSAFLFLFVLKNGNRLRKRRQEVLAVNYPLVGQMLEAIDGIFTIKALAAAVKVTSDIADQVNRRENAERAQQNTILAVAQGSHAIMSCILVLALAVSVFLLNRNSLNYSDLFAIYVLVSLLFVPLTELARLCQNLPMVSVNIKNYCHVLDLPDELELLSSSRELHGNVALPNLRDDAVSVASKSVAAVTAGGTRSSTPVSYVTNATMPLKVHSSSLAKTNGTCPHGEGHIVFQDVDFAYRGGDPVFRKLNLEIYSGEKVSLIGRSGIGKTTLLRLLMGFVRPQCGRIIVDDVDTSEVSDTDLFRKQFGMVSQQDFFFGTTLRENLLFGLTAVRSEEEIRDALRLVGILNHVDSLPKKLEAVYSADVFSGGQKQRFFIARALLRRPKVVLLDEPTSALDFESEAQIIHALEVLAGSNTTITVAHRLSTVRKSDRVVVLKDGGVMGSGTHDELYASNDYYRSFCEYNSFML